MTVMTSWDLLRTCAARRMSWCGRGGCPGHWASGQFGQQQGAGSASQTWAPAVDISERKDAYYVTAELPGVGPRTWTSPSRTAC